MKKITTIFISLLLFIGCSKSGDNINDVNNVIDYSEYPELILGTWYLETTNSTYEYYSIDPVFGTPNDSSYSTSTDTDEYGIWTTFEYDLDGYHGTRDNLNDTSYVFEYTITDNIMVWNSEFQDDQGFVIYELNEDTFKFGGSFVDTVVLPNDVIEIYKDSWEHILYREIITPYDTTNLKKSINQNNIYNKIRS